jgi:signal transduction histidine kinase
MRDRIQSAGGRLDVRSTLGEGTVVEGRFRWEDAQNR